MSSVRSSPLSLWYPITKSWRRWAEVAASVTALILLLPVSLWPGVRITPLQPVAAAGQTVDVGAASPGWAWAGPGELDPFGPKIITHPGFPGPGRPKLRAPHH